MYINRVPSVLCLHLGEGCPHPKFEKRLHHLCPCFCILTSRVDLVRAGALDWCGKIVRLVILLFALGIRIDALMQPPPYLAQRRLIAPLKETAGTLGTLEVESHAVSLRLGHGKNERLVAITSHHGRLVGVDASLVTGMQGIRHSVQIRFQLVSGRRHKALGVIGHRRASVITPRVAFGGGDLVVLQDVRAEGTAVCRLQISLRRWRKIL